VSVDFPPGPVHVSAYIFFPGPPGVGVTPNFQFAMGTFSLANNERIPDKGGRGIEIKNQKHNTIWKTANF